MKYFNSIFLQAEEVSIMQVIVCILAALLLGCTIAGVHMLQSKCTSSFAVTLAMLPAIVCVVIMMVDGNVGAGVAVAGAFSLVRFRSVPGTAKEIGTIFLAMGVGLILGMGYLSFAFVFTAILCVAMFLLTTIFKKIAGKDLTVKTLRITIPEDINYGNVFDEVFAQYTTKSEMVSVKTTNMGSMYKLQYDIVMRDSSKEKEFLDALRCRNGNLEISLVRTETTIGQEL